MSEPAFGNKNTRFLSGLTARRGRVRADWTDYLTYGYLLLGLVIMLMPVVWVVLASIKPEENLAEYPPTLLPLAYQTAQIEGYDKPLPLFRVTQEDGTQKVMAQVRRVGLRAQMLDPQNPGAKPAVVEVSKAAPIREVQPTLASYRQLLKSSGDGIWRNVYNSFFITIIATLITLVMNSMAAFALSKYKFNGSGFALVVILATLMVPPTIILVPIYLINSQLGLINSPWGVILPVISTPTGVFLLRQYMLTIPDELLEAARMDHASEWQIYWRIVLPLTVPALAVVAIFSIMSRWNDFLLPLIVLNVPETQTLQLALAGFQDETGIRWNLLLAMTTLTAFPLALVFLFLQRYITTGIASSGIK